MCGLILAPAHYYEEVPLAMRAMGYRGAEGKNGLAALGNWVLGHVRLAIQDLSDEASQPFLGPRSMTAFVGELFNHGGKGERHLLEKLVVTEDFHDVDGFWSIVHVNEAAAKVYTDHLSIKPLYWWGSKNIVCSEIEPMFELEDRPELDEMYLANVVKFGYDYSGRTPWQGIRQIPAGSVLTMTGQDVSIRSHWDWNGVASDPADLRDIIDQAIQTRLEVSDRAVAMLLSGGLDSSIIYYTLRNMGYDVQAFSVENGETEYLPAGIKPLPVREVLLPEAVRVMQAPLDLGSLVPQIQLAEAIAYQGYHICLTGDGADELFGGYRRAKLYDSQMSDVFCELPFYHLPRLDRVMMRHTIELRSPYLAPKVVAAALRLPRADRTEKQALKRAYADVVPQRILDRVKHPLKTEAVKTGGEDYRRQLVKEFRNAVAFDRAHLQIQ